MALHRERSADPILRLQVQSRGQHKESHCRHKVNRPSVKESWAPRKWMTVKLWRRLSAHCQLSSDILCLPGVMYRLEVRLYYHLHLFLCKRKERMPNRNQHQHKQAVSTTSLPFRSNQTIRPPLVEDPSRHIKIIARIMELVINGLIKKAL